MIEVLAPAGGFDSFEAAVRAGADAVYFGAGNFNARRNAKNFTEEDIRSACEFARIRGVKTYLTLNTLTADSELSAALSTGEKAAEAGIDALIVQDLGLASLIRRHLPNMPIHASTQMSVHSCEALEPLKEMGFSRVVVAREMDKDALKKLCERAKELGIQVEAFVHGALCMCLSGQCYLSSVLGSRSGNRGLCAQPCRLDFSVPGGTGKDLSLKDMSYIPHISEMTEIGITSLKIEGRMKRPEYVAAAVSACRLAADGRPIPEDINMLLSGIFSRNGHTDGYYKNNLGKEMFGYRSKEDELLSGRLLNTAHDIYRRERSSVALYGRFGLKENLPISLTVWDDSNNTVTVEGEAPQEAKIKETTAEQVALKLKKTGGTCYYFKELLCDCDGGLAISGAVLGELRSKALDLITEKRRQYLGDRAKGSTVAEFTAQKAQKSNKIPDAVAMFRSASQIPEDLDGIKAVILPAETDFSKIDLSVPVIADIPRGVLHTADKVYLNLKKAKENGVKAALCSNLAAFTLAKKAGLSAVAGFGMNVFNGESANALKGFDAKGVVCSFECQANDIVNMPMDIPKGFISYGRLPLMLVRNCPGKNGRGCGTCQGGGTLTDRLGIEFIYMCRGEFSEVFNSRPLWMLDRLKEMTGTDFHVLAFTDETKEQCARVIGAAKKGLPPDGEFTRGLYYREVL